MRQQFDAQLAQLNKEIIELGLLCETAIDNVIQVLSDENREINLVTAQELEKNINQKERDIESFCIKLILRQQPVARDLLLISAALKMITDMERIGDQVIEIIEIAEESPKSFNMHGLKIRRMSKITKQMMTECIDAFVHRDLELANKVIATDQEVNELFERNRNELIDYIADNRHDGAYAMDVIMINKYFERIGDHAVNIASWVKFAITGTHKNS